MIEAQMLRGQASTFYAQKVKTTGHPLQHCFLALTLCFAVAGAQKSPGGPVTDWTPHTLHSGSPVLFSVELDRPETAVRGKWLDHALVFTRARNGHTWFALAGIDVEQVPGVFPLEITASGPGAGLPIHLQRQVTVQAGQYKTTTLQVQQKFVAPDAATLKQIAADKLVKEAAFARETGPPLWQGDFRSPVPFSATDSYGTRRVFNGTLASIHRGTDFHAPSGTPVLAANDGEVIIAQGMFYEGNMVVVDHGQQLSTAYMHLSKIEVKPGQRVTRGQRLGLSGATGRVTGPHLHLSVRWQGMSMDPVILLKMQLPAH